MLTKLTTIAIDCSINLSVLLPFKKGLTTVESKYLPVGSTTAILQPFTYPGSNANTTLSFIGGVSSNASRFLPKLSIAAASPSSVKSLLISLSIDGSINLLYESAIASLTISTTKDLSFLIIRLFIYSITLSLSLSIDTLIIPSVSPLLRANIL